MNKRKRFFERILLAVGLALFVACSCAVAFAQNVTQGYQTDSPLQYGLIVRLKPGDPTHVVPVTEATATDMLGVVVPPSAAPVSLSDTANVAQTYVATYGQYDVLVSNEAGSIAQGNYITVSSFDGVGMKAGSGAQTIIGKALGSFDGKSNVQGTATVNGQSVALGYVAVDISVAHNPLYRAPTPNANGVPEFLSRAAQFVTDKPVGALRIYISAVVFILSVLIAGALLIGGTRSSLTAIGRNPLARHSIMRGLLQVTLIALIIVTAGLLAVYLVLRL